MDLSGVIFLVLAVAWAVYLIPKALKHHDEVARTRSIDRFSSKIRVLAHREPVDRGESRLVVSPARVTVRMGAPAPALAPVRPSLSRARVEARRTAARAAARRRRRILAVLLLATLATSVVAGLGHAAAWSVAIPGGLTLAYLALCRTQVRREPVAGSLGRPDKKKQAAAVAEIDLEVTSEAPTPALERDVDDDEDTVAIPFADLEAALASGPAESTLWDPLPVTLPTYVTKPRAPYRTVRTIDLGEPGTWTSGHTAEDTEMVAAAEERVAEGTSVDEGRRAVGS